MTVHRILGLASLALCGACALIAGVEDGELRPGAGGSAGGGLGGNTTSQGGSGAAGGSTGGMGGGGAGSGASSGVGGMIDGMINIPGATFMMGCNDAVDSQCDQDEVPYHSVTLTGYRIDMFEVTRGDYFDCVSNGPCSEPSCDWDPMGMGLQDHPVTCVTWAQADAYCAWANKRLPTEAEWEYAARGMTGSVFPWGNVFGDDCSLVNGNLCQLDTSPVGNHPTGSSPFGAMDMAGNVMEWVNDFYAADYYATSPDMDPTGPAMGGIRTVRGGGWNSAVFNFRASNRDARAPTDADNEMGFRCAN